MSLMRSWRHAVRSGRDMHGAVKLFSLARPGGQARYQDEAGMPGNRGPLVKKSGGPWDLYRYHVSVPTDMDGEARRFKKIALSPNSWLTDVHPSCRLK